MRAVFGRRHAPHKTAPGVSFRPLDDQNWRRWTTPKGEVSHAPPSSGPPPRPAFVRTCAHKLCALRAVLGRRRAPHKPHQACISPLGQPNWRRWTTPKGEASLTLGFPTLAR